MLKDSEIETMQNSQGGRTKLAESLGHNQIHPISLFLNAKFSTKITNKKCFFACINTERDVLENVKLTIFNCCIISDFRSKCQING